MVLIEFKKWYKNKYFETNLGYVINGDCLEEMKSIPDKSVDMILADLPYGQTSNKWDCVLSFDELWEHYNRIIKDSGAMILTAKGKFMINLINSNFNDYRYEWIWDKNKGSNFAHVKRMPLNVHEYAVVFYKKTPTYNPQMTDGKPYTQKRLQTKVTGIADNLGRHTTKSNGKRYPKSIIRVEGQAQRHIIHPTQKPIALFEYLVSTYTNKNDLVLDNTAGVITTGLACENLGRRWINIELEEEYCELGKSRFKNVMSTSL